MEVYCPECGSDLSFDEYRPMFPVCPECEESFHLDECRKK